MKHAALTFIAMVILATMTALAVPAYAKDHVAKAKPGESLTVFIDISVLSRKKRGAEKMNESHKRHYEAGWQAIDVAPYTENGDLQGFFVTYVSRAD